MSKTLVRFLLVAGVFFMLVPHPGFAAFFGHIAIDESCNGALSTPSGTVPLPCGTAPDPGPGGLSNAMFYNMLNPPGMVGGDVFILDPNSAVLSDILRFDPTVQGGGVFVYSDLSHLGPADIGFPSAFYTNSITAQELGNEFFSFVNYIPAAGQPGFIAGAPGIVSYSFISDVPEPAAGLLLVAGAALILISRYRK